MSKRRTALVALLALVAAAAVVLAMATTMPVGPVARSTAPGSSEDKQWSAVAPGRIEALSGQIKIAASVAGLVDKVLVKANDRVFAGEPLIRLADDELRARLAATEAQVEVRKRARDEKRASGKADDRREAQDAVADAEQAVYDAQSAVDRTAAEWRTKGGQAAAVVGARAELARARDQLTKRLEELRKVEANSPLLTAAEGQLGVARADAGAARAAVDKMTIRAPIDGTVLQVNVRAGEWAAPASPLLLLANASALRVRAELDERDLGSIKVGQAVSVRAPAFPGREFAGRVSAIAPLVEPGRLEVRGPRNQIDIDVVEVMVDLALPGPLAIGMKADVYFQPDRSSDRK